MPVRVYPIFYEVIARLLFQFDTNRLRNAPIRSFRLARRKTFFDGGYPLMQNLKQV